MELALMQVKGIVKAVGKSVGVKVKRKNMFVERPVMLGDGQRRYCFFVSTGGHGTGRWAAGIAVNWLSNVAQGVAGAGTSGLGSLGSGLAALSGKGSGLMGTLGGFRAGVIRDAHTLSKGAGNGNLLHVMKAQNAIVYYGALDTWDTTSWGLWGGLPNDRGSWNFFLRKLKDQRVKKPSYAFSGSFLAGSSEITFGDKRAKVKR
jgi:hypothetical protein